MLVASVIVDLGKPLKIVGFSPTIVGVSPTIVSIDVKLSIKETVFNKKG